MDMELHQINIILNEKIKVNIYNSKIIIINMDEQPEEPPKEEPKVEEIVPVIEIPKLPVTGM